MHDPIATCVSGRTPHLIQGFRNIFVVNAGSMKKSGLEQQPRSCRKSGSDLWKISIFLTPSLGTKRTERGCRRVVVIKDALVPSIPAICVGDEGLNARITVPKILLRFVNT